MKTIAVIGGGITGVTSAYALAQRGFAVTLFEKHRYAAMETSFANGGQLSASNAEVWNHPTTILKGLRWMLRADAPLLVNPRPSWHKLSWFAEFIRNIAHYERNTVATTALAIAAREHLFAWAAREHIDFDLKTRGILHIYRSKAGFAHAGKVSKLLAQGGLERRAVTPAEMRAIEPTLAGDYYGGYFTPSDATGDIHQFTTGLAAAAERMGVQCLFGRDVESVTHQGGRVRICTAHATEHETRVFDAVVVCAGTASRAIAAGLGDRLNIYPVKGYSITVQLNDALSRSSAPTVSLLDDETKLVSSRLGEHRLRVAGTAEFNGYNRDIRADRIQPLTDWVAQCFPGVRTENVVPWAGLRPMMPDMMPRIGRGKAPCVFYNTGHGHLGWTLCAITAEMVADAVQGSPARALAVPVLRPQAV
jgi:D-amino-acid dehydrogenase